MLIWCQTKKKLCMSAPQKIIALDILSALNYFKWKKQLDTIYPRNKVVHGYNTQTKLICKIFFFLAIFPFAEYRVFFLFFLLWYNEKYYDTIWHTSHTWTVLLFQWHQYLQLNLWVGRTTRSIYLCQQCPSVQPKTVEKNIATKFIFLAP